MTIVVGQVAVRCRLNATRAAQKIQASLPIKTKGSYWGREFYFDTGVDAPPDPEASDVVEPGTVAFWPPGRCLCLFWGPTPASEGGECRAASPVTVVGEVLNPEVLPQLTETSVSVIPD